MAQFTTPSGTGQPQRTPAVPGVTNAPNPTGAMGSTGKASESKPVPTMGDAYKAQSLAGQVNDKLPTAAVEPGQTPAGTLAERVPAEYPRNAPSRHPNVGSGGPDKSKNLVGSSEGESDGTQTCTESPTDRGCHYAARASDDLANGCRLETSKRGRQNLATKPARRRLEIGRRPVFDAFSGAPKSALLSTKKPGSI